ARRRPRLGEAAITLEAGGVEGRLLRRDERIAQLRRAADDRRLAGLQRQPRPLAGELRRAGEDRDAGRRAVGAGVDMVGAAGAHDNRAARRRYAEAVALGR